jgi:ethylbenzene dioxygenase ferredoxin component
MGNKIRLCKTEEVGDETPLGVNPEGLPALAVYKVDGDYFVTDNLCTHGNALLTDGYQEGDEIECPFHGGAFNIKTGEPTAFPCQLAIKAYPVTIEDGDVYIESD